MGSRGALTARVAVREDRRVTSKAGYWIGGGLVVVAVIGAIAWAVLTGLGVARTVDDFQRVQVPGRATMQLESRKYVVYVEGPGADSATPEVEIVIEDPRTEQPLTLDPYSASVTYSFDETGSAVRTVTPPRAGSYEVRADGPQTGSGGYAVAIGDSVGRKIVSVVVGALVIGFGLATAGVLLLIVTFVRRSRRSKPPVSSFPT